MAGGSGAADEVIVERFAESVDLMELKCAALRDSGGGLEQGFDAEAAKKVMDSLLKEKAVARQTVESVVCRGIWTPQGGKRRWNDGRRGLPRMRGRGSGAKALVLVRASAVAKTPRRRGSTWIIRCASSGCVCRGRT